MKKHITIELEVSPIVADYICKLFMEEPVIPGLKFIGFSEQNAPNPVLKSDGRKRVLVVSDGKPDFIKKLNKAVRDKTPTA